MRPDQDAQQMTSLSGKLYITLPNAFRNRKVYIRGCSCNASEYSPEQIAKSEDALKTSKRADAGNGKTATDAALAQKPPAQQSSAPQTPAAAPR